VDAGELMKGYRRLTKLRESYSDLRAVSEQAALLERKISKELEDRNLHDAAVPRLAVPPTQLTHQSFTPQEGFLLSRINGVYTLGEILKVLPGSDLENRLMLNELINRSIVKLKDQGTDTDATLGRTGL
ncbi:MAG TPA: hypothetical protein PLV66_13875, partial [Thermoanaerobaculales bacterium]|nr:hypothetical protein [Thermoanaerobaculales bacterium]